MRRTILASSIIRKAGLRSLVMLLPVLLMAMSGAMAQTTWDGSADTEWNNSENWSNGVPDASVDVTIADGPNDPIISGTTNAVAKSVLVGANSSLIIQASGSLTINGSAPYTSPATFTTALNNLGTITNGGSIFLGSAATVGTHGIVNQQTFDNAVGGSIEIDRWANTGIYNASGTFTNSGNLVIGDGTSIGQHGIWNDGTFQNNSAGTIHIDQTTLIGLMNNFNPAGVGAATFSNSGAVIIGAASGVGNYGLENLGDLENAGTGSISIDHSAVAGLYNAAGSFSNSGQVKIGAVAFVGPDGVQNDAQMTINECGSLLVLAGNLSNSASKTITNAGLVQIKNNLANNGSFTNNGVLKYGTFTEPYLNHALVIKDAPAPIFTYGSNFTGTVNGIFTDAGATQSAGTFTAPNQFVPVGLAEGSHILYAKITPQSAACSYIVPFTYLYTAPGPDINVKGNGNNIANGDNNPVDYKFTNFGPVYTLAGNAVRSFTIENKGDQPLTLTGTPVVNLSGSADFSVTSQPAATIAAGATSQFEITFDPGSLGAKTAVVSIASDDSNENPYTFTIAGEGSDVCVPTTSSGPLTWTGSTDTDWNTPCNWSPASVPAQGNEVIIAASANAPVIGAGIAALAKTVEVQTGATLTVSATASLTVNSVKAVSGSATVFYNAGTVQNNGELTLGSPSLTADFGLWNAGNFNNSHCAKVLVVSGDLKNDLSKTITNGGLTLITNMLANDGTFTNDGTLKYGSINGTVTNNQVIVHDKPTPIFSLGSGFSGMIDGIFKDSDATHPAGTFTAPDHFVPDVSLGIGNHTLYAKITPLGSACTYIVAFEYEFLTNQTTWTGNENSDWNNAANWSPGIPGILTEAIIPNVSTHDPVIGNGQSMVAYAVRVEAESSLSIDPGGTLTINGSSTYAAPFDFTAGFNNKGTVSNSGQLILGSNKGVGSYAIINQGIFNNLAGAEIRIDSTLDTGLYNASGTFTNHADIAIGANSPVGLHGIWNDAVFNNNTGGNISIDRSSAKALVNNLDETKSIHATFTNAAAITIGAAAGAGSHGIYNSGTFDNSAGGDIRVDNTTNTAIYNDKEAFTNAANITVGSVATAGNIGVDSWGTFVNKAGATLKVDRAVNFGINIGSDTLTNNGSIALGEVSKPGTTGLRNANAMFVNAGTLSINRTGNQGMETSGTAINDGTITIGGLETVGRFGLFITGTFNNNTGAVIHIDRVSGPSSVLPSAIRHQGGAFSNSGAIVIGEAVSGGDYGMRLQATFANNAGGTINIDRTNMTAIDIASIFTNKSSITIGALASVGKYGIDLVGQFNNNAGGNIKIDNSTEAAIFSKSSFSNVADITIGASASVGKYGIETGGAGDFSNAAGGRIFIDRSSSIAIAHLGGTFDNGSEITIGGVADAGTYGISNQKDFKNSPGGHIRIDRTTDTGIYQLKGTFTNEADITIGGNANVGVHGIFNETVFDNKAGGNIRIDRTSLAGLRVFNGTFTNEAGLTIGSVAGAGTYGIQNQSFLVNKAGGDIKVDNTVEGIFLEDNTFNNAGKVTIGGVSAIASLLTQQGAGIFNNNTGGVFKGAGQIIAASFTNAGGTLSPGYSPGTLTFSDGKDFGNSIMDIEVNGTGSTDHDRIAVIGTATLGGSLAVTVNYTPEVGDEITILTATSVTGTFSAVTGLAVGWKAVYQSNAVKLRFNDPMPVNLVSFNARLAGSIVRLDWHTTSETDNAGFYIERSMNGFTWEDIGFVDGNATTSQSNDYAFRDEKPTPGLNYYRLRQVDFDGTFEHSRTQAVKFADPHHEVIVWADATRQAFIKTGAVIREVTVYDLSGRILMVSKGPKLNLSSVASGIVLVRVKTDGGVVVRRLFLY
ncbi:choice-of-anchor D domain-containing protein [Dyadobacter sp. CY261]|uniref:choice-of-anchor D domain-containing protein n=1 Tax=Dyadobacter sp. CY261 TaxID=2907203 RepID=UPI001F276305|nr:choice-of-anchor D domain-containing protein [Dyadobacter sp. CY261]MCF0073053.1 choice-of-anchor D domain-containing protein [Dyadobacter sp. CY261]